MIIINWFKTGWNYHILYTTHFVWSNIYLFSIQHQNAIEIIWYKYFWTKIKLKMEYFLMMLHGGSYVKHIHQYICVKYIPQNISNISTMVYNSQHTNYMYTGISTLESFCIFYKLGCFSKSFLQPKVKINCQL